VVVDHVAVAAADPSGLLDDAVEALGAGVGGVLGEGDQDGWPPDTRRCRPAHYVGCLLHSTRSILIVFLRLSQNRVGLSVDAVLAIR
jgi:hypothetical protein